MAKQDNAIFGGDERLKKSAGEAVRGDRDGADDLRSNRDGTALSVQERRRALRQDWVQEILPTPPKIPGFHFCWLSTTNSVDPVHKRLQKGYELVKISEVPGFDQYKVEGGQFDGCVACNEMVLSKIPDEIYQDIMAIYHDDMPLEQEQSIRERLSAGNARDSNGRALVESEGDFNQLGRRPGQSHQFA